MIPHGLIILARVLANLEGSDTFLRKAVSASYYALFHAACKGIADIWYSEDTLSRFGEDWKHMYRGANHNAVLRACKDMNLIASLSPEFKLFSEILLYAHARRNLADYDLSNTF